MQAVQPRRTAIENNQSKSRNVDFKTGLRMLVIPRRLFIVKGYKRLILSTNSLVKVWTVNRYGRIKTRSHLLSDHFPR